MSQYPPPHVYGAPPPAPGWAPAGQHAPWASPHQPGPTQAHPPPQPYGAPYPPQQQPYAAPYPYQQQAAPTATPSPWVSQQSSGHSPYPPAAQSLYPPTQQPPQQPAYQQPAYQRPPYQQPPYQQQQTQTQVQQQQQAPARGRKKALLVGCGYPGTSAALNGCLNDVECVKFCLINRFGFSEAAILTLKDDTRDPQRSSTRANIIAGIRWLMSDQRPGDSLFFHFSGHGSQQRDYSGDELDGQDETILPTDYKRAGMIVDDDLNAMMVRPLQPGVTLHALVDACHSGTAMDLPYRAKFVGGQTTWKLKTRVIKGTAGGTAIQIGAAKDSQVAADTNSMSRTAYTGAATYSFIDAVERWGTGQTYATLMQHMEQSLKKHGAGSGPAGGLGGLLPGGLAGGLAGGLTGAAIGLITSFALGGAASLGGQVPVIACDKQLDLHATRLAI